MNFIERRIHKADKFQQRHPFFSFPYAVVKKYGEDSGGYNAVLLTYYAFLSLFPLLLILTSIAQLVLRNDSALRNRIIDSVTNYFPIIGQQLQHNVHGFRGAGLPLVIGILVLLYGTRGIADAFRHTVNTVWRVPVKERSGFFPALGRSFAMVAFGGTGLLAASVVASYATVAGQSYILRLPFIAGTALILYVTFLFTIRMAANRKLRRSEIRIGAAVVTFGLLLLQVLGTYIVRRELGHLDNLYGTFAVVLGLFFWLYLQAQFIVYAIEIDAVRALKLWPRSFND